MEEEATLTPRQEGTAKKETKSRIWEIDFLRGVCILAMVIDHGFYDFGHLREFFPNYDSVNNLAVNAFNDAFEAFFVSSDRQFFHSCAIFFFLISGISCSFSHNNFRHAGRILAVSGILTLFTYVVYWITFAASPEGPLDFRILFGVLYVLGFGVLLVALISKIPGSKWIELGLGSALLIWGFVYSFAFRYHGDSGEFWSHLIYAYEAPRWANYGTEFVSPAQTSDWFAKVTGLTFPNFVLSSLGYLGCGSDYFSLVPWVGFTLLGDFLGKTLYKEKKSLFPQLDGAWIAPFAWAGANSLPVYALHQPFWALILALIFCPMGYRFF